MTTAPLSIRLLEPGDTPAVARLLEVLARKFITMEFSREAEAIFLDHNDAKTIEGYIRDGFRYHVVEVQDRIVGFVGMRDNAHLFHLFVSDEMQGKGIARSLWIVARNACLAAGNCGCFTVNSSNSAVPVYESFGFIRTRPMQNVDGVLFNPMALVLPPQP